MKAKLSLLSIFFTAACTFSNNIYDEGGDVNTCPRVHIRQEDKIIVQKAGGVDLFEIEMIGYNGHCYYDERVKQDKAVVSPRFKVVRLTDTNVEDVHFSYYLETYEGPTRFLGKKTYFAEVRMPKGSFESLYTPQSGELTIPAGVYDFDMYAGIEAIVKDSDYKVK